jgi:hypothetical protein
MKVKDSYKKILALAATLFIIFAPVGITAGNDAQSSPHDNPGTTSPLSFNFTLSLAEAAPTGTIGTVGTAAGANASVQSVNFWSCAQQPATCAIYLTALVVNGAMGLLLTGGAYLAELGLQFNDNIFNSPAVQIGFSVSLAIANLGFVLGIIIIAIATIIRNQTYGIKQLLWKLVMMAILVNFGLVIAAPIVGFANSMSTYFIDATSPSAATGGYAAYVETMTSAFNPQAINNSSVTSGGTASTTAQVLESAICKHWLAAGLTSLIAGVYQTNPAALYAACKIGGVATSDSADNFWQQTMALLFDVAFSGIAAFTFIILAVLLIVRYLMLGGLLIVLPLAWLTYVFPKFDNSFSKWWNTFIKWVFFPPLALFFIYLAFTTAAITGSTNNTASSVDYTAAAIGGTGTDNTLLTTLNTQTGIGNGVFQQAADEVLLVGLMIMGLMFALSLSGKAGSTVVNGATSAAKAASGYVGKKGLRVAGRAVPQKLKENLQAGRVPLVPQRLQVAAGVGLGNLERKGRSDMVAEEAEHAEALAKDPQQFARVIGGKAGSLGTGATSKQRQMAMLAELSKNEDLMKEFKKQGSVVGGMEMQEFLQKNEGEFKRLQQNKVYDTLKDKSGLSLKQASDKGQESEQTMLALGGKAKLQEVKDIQTKQANKEDISESEKRELGDYTSRKKELEASEKLEKENPGDPEAEMKLGEKEELKDMRAMESTNGKFISDEDKAKYEAAKEAFSESSAKIKELAAKDPDAVAASFQDHEKAAAKLKSEGKPVPLTLESKTAKQIQQSIITAMAEGFSPQNAKGLIEAIGKKNNLKYFEDSIDKMDKNTAAQIQRLAMSNKQLTTWIKNNPGRNMVDLNQMFGVRPKKKKGKDEEES